MSSCCQCAGSRSVAAPTVQQSGASAWIRLAALAILAAQSMIVSLAVNLSPPTGATRVALHGLLALSAVAALALAGRPLWREGFAAARRGRMVFEQLFLVGIIAALGASLVCSVTGVGHVYYEIVAILLAIHALGTTLGRQRREAALAAARALGAEFATADRLAPSGEIEATAVTAIRAGDLVQIPAGAAVSVDGVIVAGVALVDESTLTGEPFPVVRRPGDPVRAGSRLVDGPLRVRASVDGSARQLDALFARVREAQSRPSRLQRQADQLVAWFLPAVTLVAVVTFAAWTLRSGWAEGLFHGLAVLLVACPCAMGLATPLGVWSTLGVLARRGLVARDGDLVERLAQVRQVVFDKTGTLGDEHPELVDFVVAPGFARERLLAEAAALERESGHPFARAFRSASETVNAHDLHALPGIGVAGRIAGIDVRLGNAGVLPAGTDVSSLRAELRGADGTHELFLVHDGCLAAIFQLRERLRDSATATLAELRSLGLPCIVLTGDPSENPHDLTGVESGLSPLDKARRVRELTRGGRVLFVGDGINDAPAMAEAHVALAVPTGAPLTRETAAGDLIDLRALPDAIRRCRATVRVIRQNLLFAASYNLVGISLAAAGLLHPVAAALLMLASSLTVSGRALIPARPREPRASTPAPLPV